MKPLFAILAAIILFSSCKNESQPPKKRTSDTSYPLAAYLGYQLKGILYGPVTKIIEDSVFVFKWNKDSTSASKIWTTQTRYIVEAPIPISDSLTSVTFGIPWNKRDTVIYRTLWADEKHVRDNVTEWKEAVKYLNTLRDTTLNIPIAKKDTTKKN